jgi:hypothetical protein
MNKDNELIIYPGSAVNSFTNTYKINKQFINPYNLSKNKFHFHKTPPRTPKKIVRSGYEIIDESHLDNMFIYYQKHNSYPLLYKIAVFYSISTDGWGEILVKNSSFGFHTKPTLIIAEELIELLTHLNRGCDITSIKKNIDKDIKQQKIMCSILEATTINTIFFNIIYGYCFVEPDDFTNKNETETAFHSVLRKKFDKYDTTFPCNQT